MAQLPEYRLQALFGIRERAKKDAEEFYAKEQKKLAAEEKRLKDMQQTLEDMKNFREQKRQEYADAMRQEMLTIEKIQINNRHLEMLVDKEHAYEAEITKQEEAVEHAKEAVNQALQKMLEATQEFKALEKHKEKWLQEVKKEMEKKDEEAVEDISQAQYFSRQQEAKKDE